jgi:hypothetical protein
MAKASTLSPVISSVKKSIDLTHKRAAR